MVLPIDFPDRVGGKKNTSPLSSSVSILMSMYESENLKDLMLKLLRKLFAAGELLFDLLMLPTLINVRNNIFKWI